MPQPTRTLGQMVNTRPVHRNMTPADWAEWAEEQRRKAQAAQK